MVIPPRNRSSLTAAKPAVSKTGKTAGSKRPIKSYFSPSPRVRTAPSPSLQEKIQQKAYDIYLRRGCAPGLDQFDWSVAEAFVSLENNAAQSFGAGSRGKASPQDIEGEIQKKAYELFEQKGYAHGYNEFDWVLARELVLLQGRIPLSSSS